MSYFIILIYSPTEVIIHRCIFFANHKVAKVLALVHFYQSKMTYVRRGAQIETNLAHTQNKVNNEVQNSVTVNNIVTREISIDSAPEEVVETIQERPHQGYASEELWTIPVLKKVINAINNAYFNTKLVDNIILVDDMESILSAVVRKEVKIELLEPSDKMKCLGKLNCIRDIAKITVNDNGTYQNFKYAYNDVYESMANDFRINMKRVFIKI